MCLLEVVLCKVDTATWLHATLMVDVADCKHVLANQHVVMSSTHKNCDLHIGCPHFWLVDVLWSTSACKDSVHLRSDWIHLVYSHRLINHFLWSCKHRRITVVAAFISPSICTRSGTTGTFPEYLWVYVWLHVSQRKDVLALTLPSW